MACQSFLSGA